MAGIIVCEEKRSAGARIGRALGRSSVIWLNYCRRLDLVFRGWIECDERVKLLLVADNDVRSIEEGYDEQKLDLLQASSFVDKDELRPEERPKFVAGRGHGSSVNDAVKTR